MADQPVDFTAVVMAGGQYSGQRLFRRATGRLPFAPFGLMPLVAFVLLVLFSVTAFARGSIESVAENAARDALASVGATWASARASGQWVRLSGSPPTRADGFAAVEAVRTARATTFFGKAYPITRLSDDFVWPEHGGPPPLTPESAAACDDTLARLLGPATIEFATASAEIGGESRELLDAVSRAAASCPGVLRITGHTDNAGDPAFNLLLSRRRAEAVRDALVVRGFPASRLEVEGAGSNQPVGDNATDIGRERNRRIEIRVVQPDN